MQLKNRIIYNLNKMFSIGKRLLGYFIKAPVAVAAGVLPTSVKQRISQSRPYGYLHTRFIAPQIIDLHNRGPRVYVKKGIGRMEFFDILNQRKVEYVLLRWWQDLPEIPSGEDMDILVRDEHRDLMDDLLTFDDSSSGIVCDIYTISGVKHGSRRSIPYFQANLAHTLIDTRVPYRGAYVPSPVPYFASLAYHAVFHKGNRSGLPGYEIAPGVEHNYPTILRNEADKLGIEVDVTVKGLYEWLKNEGFAPANDTLTKLVEHRPELSMLEIPLSSDVRGGELLVFIVRERLHKDGLINNFKSFLESEYSFDIIDVRMLSAQEQANSALQIRGGKWDKGPFKYSGGKPSAFVVAYDYHPQPFNSADQKKQIRMTNRHNMEAKYAFRDLIRNLVLIKGDYNGVHSADNEPDAWFYISILGEDYHQQILQEIERRRVRYAGKWGIRKVISTDPQSKVEIIRYGQGLAVKKTFRIGQERFFERELFAAKELSKELEFVPPLLEEGDGYLVVPYLENVLDTMSETEKKQVILSKEKEIIRVINSMYTRKLAFVNFTPANIIVTPDDGFYCTDFSFLQEYIDYPPNVERSYEVAGLPKTFKGDCPENLRSGSSSFNNVWGSYLGSFEKNMLIKAKP